MNQSSIVEIILPYLTIYDYINLQSTSVLHEQILKESRDHYICTSIKLHYRDIDLLVYHVYGAMMPTNVIDTYRIYSLSPGQYTNTRELSDRFRNCRFYDVVFFLNKIYNFLSDYSEEGRVTLLSIYYFILRTIVLQEKYGSRDYRPRRKFTCYNVGRIMLNADNLPVTLKTFEIRHINPNNKTNISPYYCCLMIFVLFIGYETDNFARMNISYIENNDTTMASAVHYNLGNDRFDPLIPEYNDVLLSSFIHRDLDALAGDYIYIIVRLLYEFSNNVLDKSLEKDRMTHADYIRYIRHAYEMMRRLDISKGRAEITFDKFCKMSIHIILRSRKYAHINLHSSLLHIMYSLLQSMKTRSEISVYVSHIENLTCDHNHRCIVNDCEEDIIKHYTECIERSSKRRKLM